MPSFARVIPVISLFIALFPSKLVQLPGVQSLA
jgi:hypothetical protein